MEENNNSKSLAIGSIVCSLVGLLIAGMPFGFAAIALGVTSFKSKIEATYLKILAVLGIGIGAFDIIAVIVRIVMGSIIK